jgi:plasmid stability protein
MATLYVRGVSDEVINTLKERAAAQGLSLTAYVARELTDLAAVPTNAEVVERLRRRRRGGGPKAEDIVAVIREARGE